MKKFISAISASVLAVSALPVVTASAVNHAEENILSVSAETVSEALTVDETVIPAGAVAVTVNIADNSGFISTTTKLDLGAYGVISNEKGIPAVVTGNATEGSLVTGSVNEGVAVFATVGTKEDNTDGSLFTFYVNDNSVDASDITVSDFETVGYADISASVMSVRATNKYGDYYRIGDVDNDGYIDSVDATMVRMAIAENGGNKLLVSTANADLRRFFVETTVCAQTADPDLTKSINDLDAEDIMIWYSCASTGKEYSDKSDGHCGGYGFYRG